MNRLNILWNNQGDGEKGLIFSIQRYSIQDGPGIRTTVFLKSCPLRCRWCSNPESQNPFPEIMVRAQKCQACGQCVESCEKGAVAIVDGTACIDRSVCNRCMDCVAVCPTGTLESTGQYMRLEDVVEEVSRDELFYKNSGGGVTLSGGEPLAQPDFALNFLKRCKERLLSTALDTSGYVKWDILDRVLEYTDLVLFDVKHLDPELHFQATHVYNDLILENLDKIIRADRSRVWIRVPVISGFNDSEEYARHLARRLHGMPVEKISLLHFHEWGKPKYAFLGREYPCSDTDSLAKETLNHLKDILEDEGLCVTIDY